MYSVSQKRIRHNGIYYDTAHEAICLEALRRIGWHAHKATQPADTITDREGIPTYEPDLVLALPDRLLLPGSPSTAYVECKDWYRPVPSDVPNEVRDSLAKTAAYGVVPLIVLPRKPIVYNGLAYWGWIAKPWSAGRAEWSPLTFSRGEHICDAYAEASQLVCPPQRFRRWQSRDERQMPLFRHHRMNRINAPQTRPMRS